MNNQEVYQKNLKNALTFLKDKTVYELLEHDLHYQISAKEHGKKEDLYLKIQNELLPEHKKIVDEYIDAIQENCSAVIDITYTAGLKDMLMFLIAYQLL